MQIVPIGGLTCSVGALRGHQERQEPMYGAVMLPGARLKSQNGVLEILPFLCRFDQQCSTLEQLGDSMPAPKPSASLKFSARFTRVVGSLLSVCSFYKGESGVSSKSFAAAHSVFNLTCALAACGIFNPAVASKAQSLRISTAGSAPKARSGAPPRRRSPSRSKKKSRTASSFIEHHRAVLRIFDIY